MIHFELTLMFELNRLIFFNWFECLNLIRANFHTSSFTNTQRHLKVILTLFSSDDLKCGKQEEKIPGLDCWKFCLNKKKGQALYRKRKKIFFLWTLLEMLTLFSTYMSYAACTECSVYQEMNVYSLHSVSPIYSLFQIMI